MKTLPLRIAGILLGITGLAKLLSSFGSAGVLRMPDPLLKIPFQWIFIGVGAIELAVAAYCFFGRNVVWQAALVAWLATSFICYRAGLALGGNLNYCPCLGNLTDAIHLSPAVADILLKGVLVYLAAVSYLALFKAWRNRNPSVRPATT